MIDISKIEQREIIEGFKAKFIHTENTTLAFWEVKKGAAIPIHSHMHEQTMQVIEGTFEFTVNEITKLYESGSMTVIPSDIPHEGVAVTDCKLFDVFSPVREDYKNHKS